MGKASALTSCSCSVFSRYLNSAKSVGEPGDCGPFGRRSRLDILYRRLDSNRQQHDLVIRGHGLRDFVVAVTSARPCGPCRCPIIRTIEPCLRRMRLILCCVSKIDRIDPAYLPTAPSHSARDKTTPAKTYLSVWPCPILSLIDPTAAIP